MIQSKAKTTKNQITLDKYNKGYNYNEQSLTTKSSPQAKKQAMNYISCSSNLSIVVDYLEVSCNAVSLVKFLEVHNLKDAQPEQVFKFNSEISLFYHGTGTKLYKYLLTIQIDKQDFALIQVSPRLVRGKMSSFTCQLKVINEYLYKAGTYTKLIEVMRDLSLELNNFTRLDIALDHTQNLVQFFNNYIQNPDFSSNIIYAGKAKINGMDYQKNKGFDAFYIGSRKSEKYINIYNKTKDIKRTQKNYITRFWENNLDYDKTKDIFRCELRLSSKELKRYVNLEIIDLADDNILTSIFQNSAEKLLDFRFHTDKNISRCEKIELIDFQNVNGKLLYEKTKLCQSDKYKAKLTIHIAFKLISKRLVDFIEEQRLLEVISYYCMMYGLESWFEDRRPYWTKKYYVSYK
jgi:DNA relaxase NicK